ncbi:class I SAM-dependent methyltransferase [Vulcanisaeta thermophila]|uniref:class I SAM-dependent methyltransferase n=1 Tax=Vulcanisaeta thermophila TaxID=867917 RepID=UPI001EE34A7F|nr:class I SAM-dependent methyltransferase [Vulcanisaeta thermophila]
MGQGYEVFNEGVATIYLWLLDRMRLLHWSYAIARDVVIQSVEPPGRVLEIGPGTGRLAHMLSKRGFQVVGVDLSLPMLRRAARFKEPDFINGTSWSLPLRDEYFDAVITQFTMHHWGFHEESMGMVQRTLKPRGVFIVVEVDGDRVPIPIIRNHSCSEECMRKAIPSTFELRITRRYPLIIGIARKIK